MGTSGSGRRRRIVYGAVGGVNGAACMSALRMIAHRLGVIDRTPPQVLEEWGVERVSGEGSSDDVWHHVRDQALHLGIGAVCGALYAGVAPDRVARMASGAAFGALVWTVGFAGVLPLLGVTRSPGRSRARENATNIAAHLVYGAVTGLMTEELARQRRGLPTSMQRHAARIG